MWQRKKGDKINSYEKQVVTKVKTNVIARIRQVIINQRRFNISANGLVPIFDRESQHANESTLKIVRGQKWSFLGPVQHKNEKLLLSLEHLL